MYVQAKEQVRVAGEAKAVAEQATKDVRVRDWACARLGVRVVVRVQRAVGRPFDTSFLTR